MTAQNEYGRALFLLAKEEGCTDAVLADLEATSTVLSENRTYIKLLDTPAITKEERLALIDGAFGEIQYSVKNLLKILCEHHSVYVFGEVYKTYLALYCEDAGIENVEAVTAVAMTDEQISRMKEKLSAITGKTIVIKNTVDPEILGGVKIRYAGRQVDSSLKTRLDAFTESLKSTVI